MNNEYGYILVADDNQMSRLKLSHNLEKQGHTVVLAENGRQALELVQSHSFDLILLDIIMPEMDGFQVLDQMKRDGLLQNIPVVVISALDDMKSIVRCIEIGAEDYLFKPFDPVLLKARIQSSLEKKRLRDQEQQREKDRIARELHDNLGNDLTSIKLMFDEVEQFLIKQPEKARNTIRTIKENTLVSIEKVRDFIWAINLEENTWDDVVSHLKSYALRLFNSFNIDLQFNHTLLSQPPFMNTHLRFNLFNIYKEALGNILKHSKTTQVDIEILVNNKRIEMKIVDRGVGFNTELNMEGKYGLKNMKKRAEEIGATITISSKKDCGTEVHLILPDIKLY
jgi:signal transduction histidine kinase